MNKPQWVGQKHPRGCGVAVLAMLTGHAYDAVAAYFPTDLNERGVYLRGLEDYLVDHGYAYAPKCAYMGFFRADKSAPREPWPPEPFAEVHVCEVDVYDGAPVHHFVVMLRDGTCLDPLTPEPKRLSDYHRILNVIAVVRRPEF